MGKENPIKALPGATARNIKGTIFKKGIYSPGGISKIILLILIKNINPQKMNVNEIIRKKNSFKGFETLE